MDSQCVGASERFTRYGYVRRENRFPVFKNYICIHCDQISTSENLYNGRPCTILNVVPILDQMFGKNDWIEYSSPLQKNLATGTFDELTFKIKDSDGIDIDNHGLPIIMTIEIK